MINHKRLIINYDQPWSTTRCYDSLHGLVFRQNPMLQHQVLLAPLAPACLRLFYEDLRRMATEKPGSAMVLHIICQSPAREQVVKKNLFLLYNTMLTLTFQWTNRFPPQVWLWWRWAEQWFPTTRTRWAWDGYNPFKDGVYKRVICVCIYIYIYVSIYIECISGKLPWWLLGYGGVSPQLIWCSVCSWSLNGYKQWTWWDRM